MNAFGARRAPGRVPGTGCIRYISLEIRDLQLHHTTHQANFRADVNMLIQVHSKPSRRTTYHHHGCKGAGSPTATVRFLHECLVRFVGVPPTDHAFSELLELLGPLLGPLLHELLLKDRADPTHEHVLVEPSARLYGHLSQKQLHLPSSAQSGAIRGNLARAAPPAQSTGGIRGNLRGRSEPPNPRVSLIRGNLRGRSEPPDPKVS